MKSRFDWCICVRSEEPPYGSISQFLSIRKIAVYKHCFCYSNVPTTGPFVLAASGALAGTLMTTYKNLTAHVLLHRVSQSLGSCTDIRSEALVTRMFLLCKQQWRNGVSTRLVPVCLGFDSQTWCHLWVEFVGPQPLL